MARRKDETVRKITKVGKASYGITLPISTIRQFKWRERQKVKLDINTKRREIKVRDWKK